MTLAYWGRQVPDFTPRTNCYLSLGLWAVIIVFASAVVALFDGTVWQHYGMLFGGLVLVTAVVSIAIRPVARFYGVPFVSRKEATRKWASWGLQRSRLSFFLFHVGPVVLFVAALQQIWTNTPLWAMSSSQLWTTLEGFAIAAVVGVIMMPWSFGRMKRRAAAINP
jgi:hypothetical protein